MKTLVINRACNEDSSMHHVRIDLPVAVIGTGLVHTTIRSAPIELLHGIFRDLVPHIQAILPARFYQDGL